MSPNVHSPEDYALLLAHAAAQTAPILIATDPALNSACRYLGSEHVTRVIIEVTKKEAAYSYRDYVRCLGVEARCCIMGDALNRVFGAVVAVANETRKRLAAMKAAEKEEKTEK